MITSSLLTTFTGEIDLLDPIPEMVHIADIAHALSMIPVHEGHGALWYPVALHAIHVSRLVPSSHALDGLFCCAHKAYVGMVPPVLRAIAEVTWYTQAMARLTHAISLRFSVNVMTPEVRTACLLAYGTERRDLFKTQNFQGSADLRFQISSHELRSPRKAETDFLNRFEEIRVEASQMSFLP